MYITNAFSLQMLADFPASVTVTSVTAEEVSKLDLVSAIGHADTAAVIGGMLGKSLVPNRMNVSLKKGETVIVAQLTGGRLPEGATTLPEGFVLKFFRVDVDPERNLLDDPYTSGYNIGYAAGLYEGQQEAK